MNHNAHEHEAIEEERLRRARAVWQEGAPSPFTIAAAEKRIAARGRGRSTRSLLALVVPAVAAIALVVTTLTRHRAVPIAPVSEQAPAPVILAPAAPPDPVAQDTLRLDAAEAQHRAGQCRAAKPVLEELASRGATPAVRARAQALLEEIARMQAPP